MEMEESEHTQRLAPCWPEVQAHWGHGHTLQLPDGAEGLSGALRRWEVGTSQEGRPP